MSNSKFNPNQNKMINNRYGNEGFNRSPNRNYNNNRNPNTFNRNYYSNNFNHFNPNNHSHYTNYRANNYNKMSRNQNSNALNSPEKPSNVKHNGTYSSAVLSGSPSATVNNNVAPNQVPFEKNVNQIDESKDSNNNENIENVKHSDIEANIQINEEVTSKDNVQDDKPTEIIKDEAQHTTSYPKFNNSTRGGYRGNRGSYKRWGSRPRNIEQTNCYPVVLNPDVHLGAQGCSICPETAYHAHYPPVPQYFHYPQCVQPTVVGSGEVDYSYSLPPTPSTTPSDISENIYAQQQQQQQQQHRIRASSVPPKIDDGFKEIKYVQSVPSMSYIPEIQPQIIYAPPYAYPSPILPNGDAFGSYYIPANVVPGLNEFQNYTQVYFYDPYQNTVNATVNANGQVFYPHQQNFDNYPPES